MLRSYQIEGLDRIRIIYANGKKRVLLWLATGSGKTVCFSEMVKGAIKNGKRCIIVVRGRKLVDQASHRLFREHVPHGVLMAGHWNYRPSLPVQVCSIDTLLSRDIFPDADLVVIDEAHLAVSEGYLEFLRHYLDAYIVAVTATPYVYGGLKHLADEIVHPITMQELIDEGWLSRFRYFAPSEPDLDGVKISSSTKDYVVDQLEERMVAGNLSGKVVDTWAQKAKGRPTLCFAVNIHHSKILVEKFQNAGIKAEHCDADTSDGERNKAIGRLERGETQVICNVGIFCTGVDIPSLGALIQARPTQSYNLYIQQAGRGTRPIYADGADLTTAAGRLAGIATGSKPDCILLDHAGNIMRFGFPTMERPVRLDGKTKTESHDKLSKICKQCFAVYRGKECPECGAPEPEHAKEVVETDEELTEIEIKAKTGIEQWLEYLEQQRKKLGRKQAWVYHKLLERYTMEEAKPYIPAWWLDYQRQKQYRDAFGHSPFTGVKPS